MRFVDADFTNFEEDVPNQRIVHTRFGLDIKLERRDPYGFVYIVWHKGPTPEKISGAYSDFDKARLALNTYLNEDTINKIVDEPVEIEKARYKRRVVNNG